MTTTTYVKPFSSSSVPILNACATNIGDLSFMMRSVAEAHEAESYLTNEPSPTNIHACALAPHLKLLIVKTVDPCLKQSIPGNFCSDAWRFLNEINTAELPSTIITMMIIPPLLSCASTTEYMTKRRAKRSALIASDATHYLSSTLAFLTALLDGLPLEDVVAQFIQQSYQRMKTPSNQDIEDLFGHPLIPV
jgi:hypothetical protein